MSLSGNTAALLAAVTVFVSSVGPAKAQDWREYAYPEAGFSAQFPSPPAVRAFTYRTTAGQAAPARMWAAHLGAADYGVTVVDFSNTGVAAAAAIEAAVKQVVGLSRVKLDVTERIDRQFGRELSIVGPDGGQTAAAIFFVDGKLYILTGTAAAASAEAIFPLTVRFQQSLQFIDKDGKAPRRPEDGQGPGPPDGAAGEGGRAGITLADLLSLKLVRPGPAVLTSLYKGVTYSADLGPSGASRARAARIPPSCADLSRRVRCVRFVRQG